MKTKLTTLAAILLILTLSTTGCNKRSECECQNQNKDIATIKMMISAIRPSERTLMTELTSVKYENSILELDFPAFIPDEYLGVYFWYNADNIIPGGVVISDPQVKVGKMGIHAYNDKGCEIGGFFLDNAEWWNAEYIYVDRNFTIKGTTSHGYVFDCSFEKGWNIRYHNPLKRIYTTQKPESVIFKWRYAEIGFQ